MMQQEHHEMELEQVHNSGAEEWTCPTCGRRMLLQYSPGLTQLILEQGDQTALHSGARGGMRIKQVVPESNPSEETLSEEELRALRPWLEWFDEVNFEDWWKKKNMD